MKKNTTVLLSLIFLLTFSCKNEVPNVSNKPLRNFTITCDITNINDSISVVLNKLKLDSNDRIDSIISKDGSFKFTIPSDTIQQKYEIRLLKHPTKEYINSFYVWSKDEDISISGTYDGKRIQNLKIEGSHLNNIEKKYLDIMSKYDTLFTKKLESVVTPEAETALFKKIMNSTHLDQIKFVYENPNNLVSLTYIFMHKHRISQDSLSLYYNKLDTILQNSEKGKVLKEISSTKKLKVGDYIQNFEAKDINGNIVKLSDFKEKIILLDFWASWCTPCHSQNQTEFSYLNKKYKDQGLTIISYSIDKKSAENSWKVASIKDKIDWVNITNLKGSNDPIALQYSISSIPNSFLINKEGMIVKSFIGYEKGSNLIEKEIIKLLNQTDL